jgi:uncharacterized protein YggE
MISFNRLGRANINHRQPGEFFMSIPTLFAGASAALIAFGAVAFAADQNPQPRTISLSGTGRINAAPDIAVVSLGVTSEAKSARAALDRNSKDMAALLASLKSAGIAEKDMQTANFNVQPVYTRPRATNSAPAKPPFISGYRVNNDVSVRIRKLDTLGGVLDKAVSVGSNRINGVQFSIDKPQPLRDAARKLAVRDALRKAKLYVSATNVSLGNILQISESGGTRPPQPMARARMAMSAEAVDVPIARGEQSISVRINITWEIK